MDIEKLKDMLRNAAGGPVGIQMCQEAADALEQLQAENDRLKEEVQQMRWIPVEERLPEEKQRVIVRCERVGTSVGWILWGRWMTDIGPHAGDVTHWMPLPAPPDKDNHVPAKAPNEPLTLEQLRGTPHGKIKDKTLQHICDRANELAYAYPASRIGREKWEPCDACSNAKHIVGLALAIMDDGSDHRIDTKMNCEYSFCPNCGRPLTDEAWAELERRVCGEV